MRAVMRHGIAWLASLAVLSFLPRLLSELSWKLSDLLDGSGGLSFYVRGWHSSEGQSTSTHVLMNPFNPGSLTILTILSFACIFGERTLSKHQFLKWAFPLGIALLSGLAVGGAVEAVRTPDLPLSMSITTGIVVFLAVYLLGVTYWAALLLLGTRTKAASP